ncbi:MAG: DUF4339 domain-containing protein [Synergistaceae bacterium]|nr:DUF4339 domain-containing protein [Synergistaceae bacterium]
MVQRYERWHYRREGEVCGPLALGDVLRLIEEGEIDPETEICQDLDADEWIPAGRSELAERSEIVKGEDTARFLQDALSAMGLSPREYNEFIVYWLPKMQGNAYDLIAFQGASYTDHARLTISPRA